MSFTIHFAMTHRIYLAGPDVFFKDASLRFRRLEEACERAGFEGVRPFDGGSEEGEGGHLAHRIYEGNVERIRSCHAVLANLDPFRNGLEPDSGTVFEVGMAIGLGKPVAGYLTNHRKSLEDRIRERTEVEVVRGALRGKQDGLLVEQFGFPLNLMLGCSTSLHETFEEALVQLSAELEVASKPRFRP